MNATATKLKSLPSDFDIPESFREKFYAPCDVMRLCGIEDEYTFWFRYKSGFIPYGVWLPTDRPALAWEKTYIDNWVAAGCPPMPGVIEHQETVYRALLEAVREQYPEFAAQFSPERN